MYQYQDTQVYTELITEVTEENEGYLLHFGSTCFFSPSKTIVPKPGDTAILYGKGMGYVVRGLCINNQTVFYRTEQQEKEHFEQESLLRDQRRRDTYEQNKQQLEAQISELPKMFQERIRGFQQRNPAFNWKFLPYELATLEAATLIAQLPSITEFKALSYKEQVALIPELDTMGLSGNQFGAACYYAELFHASNPLVVITHGALCPLVGCKEYGCHLPQL